MTRPTNLIAIFLLSLKNNNWTFSSKVSIDLWCSVITGQERNPDLLYVMLCAILYHFYNSKNVKKQPWRSVNFSKVAVVFIVNFEHISHLFLSSVSIINSVQINVSWAWAWSKQPIRHVHFWNLFSYSILRVHGRTIHYTLLKRSNVDSLFSCNQRDMVRKDPVRIDNTLIRKILP